MIRAIEACDRRQGGAFRAGFRPRRRDVARHGGAARREMRRFGATAFIRNEQNFAERFRPGVDPRRKKRD